MFGFKKKNIDSILAAKEGHIAKLGGWIGNRNFTDEERAEMWSKTMADVREYSVKTMSENTDRSRARRDIAMLWIKTQLALVLCCAISGVAGDIERFDMLWKITGSYLMMGGTGAIIAFFFGAYAYGTHIKKLTK